MNIKKAIEKVVNLEDLSEGEMRSVFREIMGGKTTPAQIGAFITALRMKGETVDEITGAAKVMRKKAARVKIKTKNTELVDTCGTGGSGTKTFNISTLVAFILAGEGVKVAKHGNRSVSSSCGSADVLEELGVKIDIAASKAARCIDKTGLGFLFAPLFHGAMKHASLPRREIGVRTIFNILGPLCNPLGVKRQIMGIYKEELTEVMAKVLKKLGSKRAYVVSGCGGLDEVTIAGRTKISELKGGRIRTYYVTPGTFGFKKTPISEIRGGSTKRNAKILKDVLGGARGPKRDAALMNAAVAFMVSGKAKNIKEGVKMAERSIDSGRALEKMKMLIKATDK
ncbi:MAG: anthranilate phosphoribosyltransferase [Candidatus Aadella gelida]|nr:anthranilate phosphoribosyltransferase [Candidatus Aadella gelida]